MLDINHLSYSSINTWQLCPRSWAYRYVEKVPTRKSPSLVFGSCFHTTIESYLRARHRGQPEEAISIWPRVWRTETEGEDIDWGTDTPEQLSNDGVRMFGHKDTQALLHNLQPLVEAGEPVIERKVELRVPGVPIPIIGYCDMVGNDGTIFDFKTAGRSWTQEKAEQEDQPTYYLAAMQQSRQGGLAFDAQRKFTHIVWTKGKNPRVDCYTTTRSAHQMMRLICNIQMVWRGIAAGVFPSNTGTWKHSEKWCEFWDTCPDGGKE